MGKTSLSNDVHSCICTLAMGKTSPSNGVLFQTLLYMYIGHGKDLPSNGVLFLSKVQSQQYDN